MQSNAKPGKTMQNQSNVKQCKAMQSNAKLQSNAKQCKAMQTNAKKSNAKQSNAKQWEARQSNAKQCKAMQSNAKQSNAKQWKCKTVTPGSFEVSWCLQRYIILVLGVMVTSARSENHEHDGGFEFS